MNGALTLFESPSLLAKRWTLDAGEPVKHLAAQMARGSYTVPIFDDVMALADLLDSVSTHQAVSCSLPTDGSVSGFISTKANWKPGTKTRSKGDFNLRAAPGSLFFDHDPAAGGRGMNRDELWSHLVTAVPALTAAGVVWRPSGSSYIYHGDREVTGLKGQHLAVMLLDASDGPRVTKVLDARLWLADQGRIVVSSAGSLLERSPIDTAVSDPARLMFVGGAHCEAPLHQRRGPPIILSDGGFLDTRSLVPDLTADEQGLYEALVQQAKAAARPAAIQKRDEHRRTTVARRLPDLMRTGATAADAEQRIGQAVESAFSGILLADFELTLFEDDGTRRLVTVAQVLADRERYHEKDCLDPLNPAHRGGNAADCRLFLMGTSPIAYSFDSGVYRLRAVRKRIVVAKGSRAEAVTEMAETLVTDPSVFVTDIAPVVVDDGRPRPLTVDRVMSLIGALVVLVTKTAKGDVLLDVTREQATLVLTELSA